MKIFLSCTLLLFFSLCTEAMSDELNNASVQLDEIENKALRPFFNALRSGNVEAIKRYLGGKKYEESRFLSNEDKGYADMLKEHYKDAAFSVERAISVDDQIVVDVVIEFPGRGRKITQFYLQDQIGNHENAKVGAKASDWRIIDQKNNRDR